MENQNQNPKQQLVERLKQANNVLVTVSANPSVDQLSAAIGLTLLLNHLDKHATAVFSGEVPNTLEFLKPEETLEKNTDSLRDFIISLDKAKADKLRYKVEDKMVKIFITPYRTSLTEADLVFGQGDFNVDVVVALGVQEKDDLDQAIISHGRILHDAVVATVNTVMSGQLGSINWVDAKASSLSEMLVPVCQELKADSLDSQMATAFLTGIVAETQRFSNEKTSSDTMSISAKLMSAGANQQLVATKLEQPVETPRSADNPEVAQAEDAVADALQNDGSLEIDHDADNGGSAENSAVQDNGVEQTADLPDIEPEQQDEPETDSDAEPREDKPSRLILQPPTLGGTLTANTKAEGLDPSTDPLTLPAVDSPLLTHEKDDKPTDILAPLDEPAPQPEAPVAEPEIAPEPEQPPIPEPVSESIRAQEPPAVDSVADPLASSEPTPQQPQSVVSDTQTLTELEAAVDSPHLDAAPPADVPVSSAPGPDAAAAALEAAHQAIDTAASELPEKPAAFNSEGLMDVSHELAGAAEAEAGSEASEPTTETPVEPPPIDIEIDPNTGEFQYPENLVSSSDDLPSDPTAATVSDPTAPPPVPPPMAMPPLMPPAEPPVSPDNLPPVNP